MRVEVGFQLSRVDSWGKKGKGSKRGPKLKMAHPEETCLSGLWSKLIKGVWAEDLKGEQRQGKTYGKM